MVIVKLKYPEIMRGNIIKDDHDLSIIINKQNMTSSKYISIISSKTAYDAYRLDQRFNSLVLDLNLSCNDTLKIISDLFKSGELVYENDRKHNRDIFEVGLAIGNEFLINVFCDFVKTYIEINLENFYDIYDAASVQNDTNKINECISFFASRMSFLKEEYKIETIKRYGYDFFESVLISKSLKISTEDSLCKTIISMSKHDNIYFELLKYVRIEFCSKNVIEDISNYAEANKLESISSQIFKRALLQHSPLPHKLELSSINELHWIDSPDENIRKLRSLTKAKDNFGKIYELLAKASNEGDLLTIKLAVDEKYSDVRGDCDYNMILEASYRNNLSLVKHLYINGADIRSKSTGNWTTLHCFCYKGNL
ncbi:hypothetical protein TVAG_163770 [Trichomonas vaginalis G3]|uniref:Uncharacterized protein n=1 Tax=Trichomonas vaginalis (strain ATCC PRA-98 / G3) TaxID=412133 RepID=A2DG54_TRIV3|nr:spectrin binding [Trichomonas vaginalis G3]EAY20681.1 hypothetical protein TVAG_163770 [Trichomonas vaginalis G3]KAI5487402.1 spectrin binding [Trichomonas vaginalis G3]|eukprot:XP_001581667.1 hypothetical protein [Trichomonas vaginalis G3]